MTSSALIRRTAMQQPPGHHATREEAGPFGFGAQCTWRQWQTDFGTRRPDGLVRRGCGSANSTSSHTRRCRHADCVPRTRKGRRRTQAALRRRRETKHEGSTSSCRDRPCRRHRTPMLADARGAKWNRASGDPRSLRVCRWRGSTVDRSTVSGSSQGSSFAPQMGTPSSSSGKVSILCSSPGARNCGQSLDSCESRGQDAHRCLAKYYSSTGAILVSGITTADGSASC